MCKSVLHLVFAVCLLALPLVGVRPTAASPVREATAPPRSALAAASVAAALEQMPLLFVANAGQLDPRVAYTIQGQDKALYFTAEGLTFSLTNTDGPPAFSSPSPARWTVKLTFVGANRVRPQGLEQAATVVSYFSGPRGAWHTGVPTYRSIIYRELWSGIDLLYSGTVNELKYQFIVHPGADPAQIRLGYEGASAVTVDEEGRLQVATPVASFHDAAPVAYQETADGGREAVAVGYALGAEAGDYGFRVGAYDAARPLILDPAVLVYCGYIGGGGTDHGYGIAVDSANRAYVVGYTGSNQTTFPATGGPDLTRNGGDDAFVARVAADGASLEYCGYIGGAANDYGYGIAVDSANRAYVVGYTGSDQATFPVTGGPDLTHNGGGFDAFVARVAADGASLEYCGYIGGAGTDYGYGIAVDSANRAYVAGYTDSDQTTFPATGGPDLTHSGVFDAFVARVAADGASLEYCGYIGGAGSDYGYGIAVDGANRAYVVGYTGSDQATFPATGGPDLTHNGGADAFVARVAADGANLEYCGYIGGAGSDYGYGIAVDGANRAYVVGYTTSDQATFPVTGGPDLTHNGGGFDVFVARVAADGASLEYCGYIGGVGIDYGRGIAVDSANRAYVAGYTTSNQATFPVTGGPDLTHNGGVFDVFVARVAPDGASLEYCGYVGGAGSENGRGIAVDSANRAYVVGYTSSDETTFPVMGGPDLTYNDGADVFVARVDWEAQADLALSKRSAPAPASAGSAITYTLVVTNAGLSALTAVTLTDALPPQVVGPTYSPASGVYDLGTGAWSGLSLGVHDVITLTIVGTVQAGFSGPLVNTAIVTPVGATDPRLVDNSAVDTNTVRGPTAVDVLYFRAEALSEQQVRLSWAMAYAPEASRFLVLRSPTAARAGASLVYSETVRPAEGLVVTYTYTDSLPGPGPWWYWLVVVDAGGAELHEPYVLRFGPADEPYRLWLPVLVKRGG